MQLYADALRQLGDFLGERSALDLVGGSAVQLATELTAMPFFDDRGFYKRAQIVPNDFTLAGARDVRRHRRADDLRRQPRPPRAAGRRRADATTRIWRKRSTPSSCSPPGEAEREIRACAVHACAQIAERLGIPERDLDVMLWNRGQAPEYKSRPRHRTRTVYY